MNTRIATFPSAVRVVLLATIAFLGLIVPAPAQVSPRMERAIQKTHAFVTKDSRVKDIHGYLHMGTRLTDVTHLRTTFVRRNGNVIPDHFALVYRFSWNSVDWTDVAFLCDGDGDIYEVQALDSTGIVQRPFVIANASIKLFGELIYAAFQEKMTDDDRKLVRSLIENSDAKGMLELALKLQQSFGG